MDCDLAIIAVGSGANPLLTQSTPDLKLNQWEYIEADPETGKKISMEKDIPFFGKQVRRVLGNCGRIDPTNIEHYIAAGGYHAIVKALSKMPPDQVIDEVQSAKLRGRGGAGFPTALKWKFARQAGGRPKYVVCNADEGDPGAFMDRSILEADPHSILEGMIIAAKAINAHKGYVYARTEYPLAIKRLQLAIVHAKERGLLGEDILGSGFSFDIEIYQGAGAFVCGEETALLASIEGRRGMPRIRPPFPADRGLYGKPTVINLIGYPPPGRQIGNLFFATTLHEAAELATKLARSPSMDHTPDPQAVNASTGSFLRGLFSGGTLAYEALLGLQTFLTPIYSNVPLRPEQKLEDSMVSLAHTILDLGEDEFTQGRLHPMIDNDLRLRRLRQEAADPTTGFILLDVVLGEGAHPDPASELAPAIAEIKAGRNIEVMAVVLGTDEDPQGVDDQIAKLSQAGAVIVRDVSEAVALISQWLKTHYIYAYTEVLTTGFGDELIAINVGLETFYDSLNTQGASAVHVEWRPPAGGKDDLMAILAKMKNM